MLNPREVEAIHQGSVPAGEHVALRQAQRAIDDAVRSVFELAVQLEVLSEVISQFNEETRRELRERQDAIIGDR